MIRSMKFITQFDESIPFVEGYREAHKRPWAFAINKKRADESEKTGLAELYGNTLDYGIVADFLIRHGLWDRKYENSLDIGGSVGIFSRLLRANGKVKRTTVVDIKDGSKRFSWSRYCIFWLKYKTETLLSRFLPASVGVLRKNNNKFGYGMTLRSSMWNMGLWWLPKLDHYAAQDFNSFEPDNKFDFIISVNAIAFFDPDRLFRKLRELATPNATICLFTDYWWYPVNATTIYGDFPYTAQRLTKSDLTRYFSENFPDTTDAIKAYEFYHDGKQPVIGSFVKTARENGFSFVGSERLMPKQWSRDNRSIFLPDELPLEEVLRDIHKFRSDVTLEDLHTSHILMAFKHQPKT